MKGCNKISIPQPLAYAVGIGIVCSLLNETRRLIHDIHLRKEATQALVNKFDTPATIDNIPGTNLSIVELSPGKLVIREADNPNHTTSLDVLIRALAHMVGNPNNDEKINPGR